MLSGYAPAKNAFKTMAAAAATSAARAIVRRVAQNPAAAVQNVRKAVNKGKQLFKRAPKPSRSKNNGGGSSSAPAFRETGAYVSLGATTQPYFRPMTKGDVTTVHGREIISNTCIRAKSATYTYYPDVAVVIHHNPCYWQGTRIANIARCYQLFSVKKMKIIYVPKVATSTAGSVTIGTIIGTLPAQADDSVVLANGIGSVRGPVWQEFSSSPDLSKTPMRWYNAYDAALARDYAYTTLVVPSVTNSDFGSIFVEYSIELTQPLFTNREFVKHPNLEAVCIDEGGGSLVWKVLNLFSSAWALWDVFGIITYVSPIGVPRDVDMAETVFINFGAADSAGAGYCKTSFMRSTGEFIVPTVVGAQINVACVATCHESGETVYLLTAEKLKTGNGIVRIPETTTTSIPVPMPAPSNLPPWAASQLFPEFACLTESEREQALEHVDRLRNGKFDVKEIKRPASAKNEKLT